MTEEWRDIPGYEGAYQVSNLGRVRSLPGGSRKGGILGDAINNRGYVRVVLCASGYSRVYQVHQLVASAFFGPCPAGYEVCHRNGVKTDSRASNLRYGTHSSNIRDAVQHGTHYCASLTHCKHGHEFTPENVRIEYKGIAVDGAEKFQRRCIACRKRDADARRERARATTG